jgi:hypothetical protein
MAPQNCLGTFPHPRPGVGHLGDGSPGVALDKERLLASFGVRREGAIWESEPVRLVDDVDDPTRCDRRDAGERDGQHDSLPLADRRSDWNEHQAGSSVRFPPVETLDGTPIHVLAGAQFDHMPIVPIPVREAPSRRPDVAIRHLQRRLLGAHLLQVNPIRPAEHEHDPTMPGQAPHPPPATSSGSADPGQFGADGQCGTDWLDLAARQSAWGLKIHVPRSLAGQWTDRVDSRHSDDVGVHEGRDWATGEVRIAVSGRLPFFLLRLRLHRACRRWAERGDQGRNHLVVRTFQGRVGELHDTGEINVLVEGEESDRMIGAVLRPKV